MAIGGCGKYEEGPAFSLKSKKARVVGKWEVVKIFENGVEEPMEDLKMFFEFEKDGTGEATVSIGSLLTFTNDLEWEFSDTKEEFRLRTRENKNEPWDDWDSSEILKLTNSEFWLKNTATEDGKTEVSIIHLEKK